MFHSVLGMILSGILASLPAVRDLHNAVTVFVASSFLYSRVLVHAVEYDKTKTVLIWVLFCK